jgi:hypothetical protein
MEKREGTKPASNSSDIRKMKQKGTRTKQQTERSNARDNGDLPIIYLPIFILSVRSKDLGLLLLGLPAMSSGGRRGG